MDDERKGIYAAAIAGIVIVAVLLAFLVYPAIQSHLNGHGPPFSRSEFNSKQISLGSMNFTFEGLGENTIVGNNSILDMGAYISPPGLRAEEITSDHALYREIGNGYSVIENVTYQGGLLTIISKVTASGINQSFVIHNTGDITKSFSLGFHASVNGELNTSLYMNSPSGPGGQNVTIVPHTYGMSEKYTFLGSGPLAASFPGQNNIAINWSDLAGLLYSGSISFGYNTTGISLNFSRVALIAGQSLEVGSIEVE